MVDLEKSEIAITDSFFGIIGQFFFPIRLYHHQQLQFFSQFSEQPLIFKKSLKIAEKFSEDFPEKSSSSEHFRPDFEMLKQFLGRNFCNMTPKFTCYIPLGS